MPNLLDYPVEDFRNVLDTNLIGPFLLIKSALPAIIEGGGSIINVTSDAGQVGYPCWGAYGISKFGLEGMSQTWASELENTEVASKLGRSRQHEHGDASCCRTGGRSERMG